jgi:uncharacterized membrane protein YphA (DoxX/SURF4 family)
MAKSLTIHPNSTVAGLVLTRLFLGAFFLAAGILQLAHMREFAGTVREATLPGGALIAGNKLAFVSATLTRLVAPRATGVAWAIVVLMLVVGALLLVGLCTRLAGLIALGMTAIYLLAAWHIPAGLLEVEPLGAGLALLVMEFAVIASAAGRTFGLDAAVSKKSKNKLFW